MLDVLFTCGQVLCLTAGLYGAYLVIKHNDTFRAGVRALRKTRGGRRDGMSSLESPVSGASMTASARSPSRAGSFPGATAEQPVLAGGFFSRLRRRSAQAAD